MNSSFVCILQYKDIRISGNIFLPDMKKSGTADVSSRTAVLIPVKYADYDSVALSIFFIMEKITMNDMRHKAMRIAHTPHRGSLFQRSPGMDVR